MVAIAQLEQSNIILAKLVSEINFVVSILEILASGEVGSITGAIGELDALLG